jgi:hypothetical protein
MAHNHVQQQALLFALVNSHIPTSQYYSRVNAYQVFNNNSIKFGTVKPDVLYGFETWLLTLREERWVRVFENRVFRRIFRGEVTSGENYIMRSLMVHTPYPILLR